MAAIFFQSLGGGGSYKKQGMCSSFLAGSTTVRTMAIRVPLARLGLLLGVATERLGRVFASYGSPSRCQHVSHGSLTAKDQ